MARNFLWIVALLLAGLSSALAQKSGGILRVEHRDNPPSASIHEEATISTIEPFSGVFNNLVVFDPASPENRLDRILPELATGWAWSDGGKRLTLQLHSGVTWHDGKPFTSADVKCTWDTLLGRGDTTMRKNPRKSWYFNVNDITTSGPAEVSFNLKAPQPSLLAMLAGGMSPVYPCHVTAAQMRTHPIGTGPFTFVEFKQNEGIKLARNPHYWKPGLPYLDGIEFTIIPNRATAVLAFTTGKFDMTFTGEMSPILTRDIEAAAPSATCRLQPTNTQANLLVNRDRPPFNDAAIRRAMVLAIDRQAFSTILSQGVDRMGGALLPPPQGQWGMSEAFLATVAGYRPDVENSREAARKIMAGLGYSADKPLRIKVSTRNIPVYRDPAVILIDHLKQIFIEGELEVLDTSVWYARLLKKDYAVALNIQGVGIDDPDVVFFETFACDSERNYTGYCSPEVEAMFHQQSEMGDVARRKALVWEIDKRLQEDGARPVIDHGWASTCWQNYVHGVSIADNTIYNHWRFETVWLDR